MFSLQVVKNVNQNQISILPVSLLSILNCLKCLPHQKTVLERTDQINWHNFFHQNEKEGIVQNFLLDIEAIKGSVICH